MAKRKIYQAANRFTLKDFLFIAAGVAAACIGLEGFLLPSHFLDGGVVGISIIVRELTGYPLAVVLFCLNLPFIWMGRQHVSTLFAIKALGAITALALCLWFVHLPPLTYDALLVAVFGGFFIGLGIGLAIRGGAVLDGTEVMALFLAKKSSLTVGDYIMIINIAIFTSAVFVFGLERALYAMLTYISASRTVDFVVYGIEEYMAVQIFSDRSAALYKVLETELKLNVNVMNGQRGAPQNKHEKANHLCILHTVVTRLELGRLLNTIQALDPEATIVYHPVTDMHHLSAAEKLNIAAQRSLSVNLNDPV